jgi:hypothetical protein
MNSTTVSVDLAKSVFELAVAGADCRISERHRLSRAKFAQFFVHRPRCSVVMEACGSAHYWARRITGLGHEVRLLPAHYVKAYVKRNKTDRADAAALLDAARSPECLRIYSDARCCRSPPSALRPSNNRPAPSNKFISRRKRSIAGGPRLMEGHRSSRYRECRATCR